ncbi:MAG: peptidoglycan editing factor PgeF [Desulfobacteraceae bacterium]|nr:peptidoglycan editing factor PgeF [Desulfobacteraceae bacterium]
MVGTEGTRHLEFNHIKGVGFITHGIFSRAGGFSKAPFDGLNVGLSTGDSREAVLKNRELVSRTLGGGAPVYLNQVHSDTVLVLKKDKTGNIPAMAGDNVADAVVTDIPDLALVIQVADCQAVILADPVKRVVANIHSGWKGSVGNIIARTIDAMEENFGSAPGDILAGIGPSLGPCCAEFVNYRTEIPEHLWYIKDGNDHFDFWRLSHDQLEKRGVKPGNIVRAGICTKCSPGAYFSYRHEKVTGRFASVIKIT